MGTTLHAVVQTFSKGNADLHTCDMWVNRASVDLWKDYDLMFKLDEEVRAWGRRPDQWIPKDLEYLDHLQCFEPDELPRHESDQYTLILMLVHYLKRRHKVRILFARC